MADTNRPAGRRNQGAYQPIEVLDDSQGTAPSRPADSGPQEQPATQDPPEPRHSATVAAPLAVRFGSAASALAFAGQLLSVGRADGLTFCSDVDHFRWVRALAELDITRELATAAHGSVFIDGGAGRLIEDPGWGDPPTTQSRDDFATTVDSAALAPTSLPELVRIAGLHRVREQSTAGVRVLLPGYLMPDALRRALDRRIEVAHRPVRLHPLFDDTVDQAAMALIELRLTAQQGHIPPSLLAALAREPLVTVCRAAGDDGNLLMQYGMASPLLDHLLAGLLQGQGWVLTYDQLGCRVVEPVGEFADSAACVELRDAHSLQSGAPGPSDDRPRLPELRLVRERTHGRAVDAILLADDDLSAIALLLEGHPLSESAQVIRGRDRHLLVAPGGVLDRLPVGESLYRLGPGPLYVPLGFGTRPQLPVSARRALFGASDQTAVILLADSVLHFSVQNRGPVWTLWVGPPPEIDMQLPAEVSALLDDLATPVPSAADGADDPRPGVSAVGRTWLDDAMDAEFRGALTLAAELHERHGDPLRAARLFARAAEENNADDDGVSQRRREYRDSPSA